MWSPKQTGARGTNVASGWTVGGAGYMDELFTVPYWYPLQRPGWEECGLTFSLGRSRLRVSRQAGGGEARGKPEEAQPPSRGGQLLGSAQNRYLPPEGHGAQELMISAD